MSEMFLWPLSPGITREPVALVHAGKQEYKKKKKVGLNADDRGRAGPV